MSLLRLAKSQEMEHPKITPSYAFPVPPRKRVAMKILLLSYYLITGGIVWSLCSCIGILEKKIDEHGSISHGILPWKRM